MNKNKSKRQKDILKFTAEFIDRGYNIFEARKRAKQKQFSRYIGSGRSDIAPMKHPCAGNDN